MTAFTDVASLRSAVAAGRRMKYVFFWTHEGPPGPVDGSCLSQWYPAAFTVDGVTYPTAEHWMMAAKARLFRDAEAERRVLAAHHPAEAKTLGRTVRGFDNATWSRNRLDVVARGNLAKFSQNPPLRDYLLRTGDRVLAEASPVDRVWGVGLAAGDPGCDDPARWRGENLLGFVLMRVRDELSRDGGC